MVSKSLINGSRYEYIVNPNSGRKVSIRGKIGKKILKNYYNFYNQYGIQIGGNKYFYVINPRTGRRVSLHGKYGQKIVSQFGGESYWSRFKRYSGDKAKKAYKFAKDHKKEIAAAAAITAGLGAAYAGKKYMDNRITPLNTKNLPPNLREPVGIQNVGNTCYLNSLFQNLNNLPEIGKELRERRNSIIQIEKDINTKKNKIKNYDLFIGIIDWMNNKNNIMKTNDGHKYKIPGNSEIKKSYWAKYYNNPRFDEWYNNGNIKWNSMQEPHEFLLKLIDNVLNLTPKASNSDNKNFNSFKKGQDKYNRIMLFGFYNIVTVIVNKNKNKNSFLLSSSSVSSGNKKTYLLSKKIVYNSILELNIKSDQQHDLINLIKNDLHKEEIIDDWIITKHKQKGIIDKNWSKNMQILKDCPCRKEVTEKENSKAIVTKKYKLKPTDFQAVNNDEKKNFKINFIFEKCVSKKNSLQEPIGKYVAIRIKRETSKNIMNHETEKMENKRFFNKQRINITEELELPLTDNNNKKYNKKIYLKGVCVKTGSLNAGHWVAFIKNNYDKWFLCDDKIVTPMNNFQACHEHKTYSIATNGVLFFFTKEKYKIPSEKPKESTPKKPTSEPEELTTPPIKESSSTESSSIESSSIESSSADSESSNPTVQEDSSKSSESSNPTESNETSSPSIKTASLSKESVSDNSSTQGTTSTSVSKPTVISKPLPESSSSFESRDTSSFLSSLFSSSISKPKSKKMIKIKELGMSVHPETLKTL